MINLRGITPVLKLLWTDKATIKADTDSYINDDGVNEIGQTVICTDEPCKLSPSTLKPDTDKTFYNASSYDALLIIDNRINIPSGADITITDVNGNVTHYKRSSKGFTGYQSHQEVGLMLDERA